MSIDYPKHRIINILGRNEENRVVIPNFQRDFVWDAEKQKDLIATLLVDLPFGSLLTLKGRAGDFSARKLCFPVQTTPKDECEYVLDGQQRLSTIKAAFFDIYSSVSASESPDEELSRL